jgi:hypothetical protein
MDFRRRCALAEWRSNGVLIGISSAWHGGYALLFFSRFAPSDFFMAAFFLVFSIPA